MIHVKAFVIGAVIVGGTLGLIHFIVTGSKLVLDIIVGALLCVLSYGIGRAVLEGGR
jgi:hypothetical protein